MNENKSRILEYWEFQKNLYNHLKFVKQSHEYLNKITPTMDIPEVGKWAVMKDGESVFLSEIEDGKYTGVDIHGNEVKGKASDIKSQFDI